ncbi:MAG: 2-dehydropantoate 2-reductase [Nanoarchaeota archaeon]
MKPKKILICGAGSIGIYVGAKLYHKKHDVTLFGRRKLRGVDGEVFINNKRFDVPKGVYKIPKNEKYDFIFITTKLYDLDYMINLLKRNKIKGPIFIGIQNGIVDVSKYEKILKKKIIPITVFSGFNLNKNKLNVTPTPIGWKTEFSKQGKEISAILLDAKIPCHADKSFDRLRAEKTVINCCLNALSAIENKPFSYLFKNNKTKERIEKLFEECYEAIKKEHELDEKHKIKKRMFEHWKNLNHYSSTCQDIHSGRKNEVKFFNGYIVELGKKHNILVENNKEILRDIRKIAN